MSLHLKLSKIKKIEGKLILETGLHIGAGDTEMHIGGVDSPVVRNPYTMEPYIPGSSLKGKIRSLLEQSTGLMKETEGKVLSFGKVEGAKKNSLYSEKDINLAEGILKVFGLGGNETNEEIGPSRASFSDCSLDKSWREKAIENNWSLTEEKTEVSIDRISGTAGGAGPRHIERVPAGAEFIFQISFKILQEGDEKLLENVLLRGLKILSMDSLGGSGSRGYGKISIKFNDKEMQQNFANLEPWK